MSVDMNDRHRFGGAKCSGIDWDALRRLLGRERRVDPVAPRKEV